MMKWIKIFATIFILLIGFLTFQFLLNHKVKTRKKQVKILPPLVEIIRIQKFKQPISIDATGNVKPFKTTLIQPQVSGKIIYVSENFFNGKIVRKNEILIKIDDADYRAAFEKAKFLLSQAVLHFAKVKEEANRAVSEWENSKKKFNLKKPSPLRLYTPQLNAAKAELNSAKAQVKLAEIKLKRTIIRAPFKGIITNKKDVGIGSVVTKGTLLAKLIGIEKVEVVTPIPDYNYQFIDFKNQQVDVIMKLYDNVYRYKGIVNRSEKIIDPATRMINIYTIVKNPYNTNLYKIPLFIGAFVNVKLNGKMFDNISKIPITAIHGENEIWIAKNHKLFRKRVKILKINRNYAYISGSFNNNDLLIVTNLPYVSNGMKIRYKKN